MERGVPPSLTASPGPWIALTCCPFDMGPLVVEVVLAGCICISVDWTARAAWEACSTGCIVQVCGHHTAAIQGLWLNG